MKPVVGSLAVWQVPHTEYLISIKYCPSRLKGSQPIQGTAKVANRVGSADPESP
jgi:hypothetical protein